MVRVHSVWLSRSKKNPPVSLTKLCREMAESGMQMSEIAAELECSEGYVERKCFDIFARLYGRRKNSESQSMSDDEIAERIKNAITARGVACTFGIATYIERPRPQTYYEQTMAKIHQRIKDARSRGTQEA